MQSSIGFDMFCGCLAVAFVLPKLSTFLLALCVTADSYGAGSAPGLRIGGMSGGVRNDELVKELKEVALEHVREVCQTSFGHEGNHI